MSSNAENQPIPAQPVTAPKLSKADFAVTRRLDRKTEPQSNVAQNKQNAQNFQNN